MEDMITYAVRGIGLMLAERSYSNRVRFKLVNVQNLLHRLLESNSSKNEWFPLFCRQLKRLIKYNKPLSDEFWIELHDDILYALEGPDGNQVKDDSWQRVLERIKWEIELEQRELQFQQIINMQTSLNDLICEKKKFYDEYLQKCIYFHSKVQVRGLSEVLENLLSRNCGLTDSSSSYERQIQFKEKREYVEINFDCSNRTLKNIQFSFLTNTNSYRRVNTDLNNFLPSVEVFSHDRAESKTIKQVLQSDRWIVILGDPGSAKTTLLRWITLIFAKAALRGDSEVVLEGDYHLPVRIPILIRIGEFATWLVQNRTRTLFDYIGEHKWFSERYCHSENENLLKELIYHGHALILLDGLDEILEVRQRGEIIEFVRKFIDNYVRAPDFFSAFDDKTFNLTAPSGYRIIETQPPRMPGGNQIIMTSRIIGYQLYPLMGSFIQHYSLLLLDQKEAKKFAEDWIVQVEDGIFHALRNEGIQGDKITVKILSKTRRNAIKTIFENTSNLLLLNPSLLSLICTSIFRSPNELKLKSRIEVYYYAVQSAMKSWITQTPNISENVLTNFLINISTYLHLESPSGLIDAFDMRQLSRFTLKQEGLFADRRILVEYADKLIYSLTLDNGIVAERGLETYGFLHLSFQEYFVSQSFVRNSLVNEVAKCIITFIIHPRFRESLQLALGWISWKWSSDDYNKICDLLVAPTIDYALPFGTLLFFDAFDDFRTLPSESIIFIALNILLNHSSTLITKKYFISNLSKLPEKMLRNWMQSHLNNDSHIFKFCQCLLFCFNPSFHGPNQKLFIIYQQLLSLNKGDISVKFIIDQTLRRIMMSINASDINSIKELFSNIQSYDIPIFHSHPLILSIIIAVYGTTIFKIEKKIVKIHFSSEEIYRKSSILKPIIRYLNNRKDRHSTKFQTLLKQYENTLINARKSDISDDIVETFIAVICLKGVLEPLFYLKYDEYKALPLAIDRLKWTWFYLKKSYKSTIASKSKIVELFPISEVEQIINVLISQFIHSDKECLDIVFACVGVLNKFHITSSFDSFISNIHLSDKVRRYLIYQPEFHHLKEIPPEAETYEDTVPVENLQHSLSYLLRFIPQSLQKLYCCIFIDSNNNTISLPLVILLSQCLILLEEADRKTFGISSLTARKLQSALQENGLTNYYYMLNCPYDEYPSEYWDKLVNMERKNISHVKNEPKTKKKDLQLFSASISLARIFQVRVNQVNKYMGLSITDSEEVYLAVMDIFDPVLRIVALSMILDMKDPVIFDGKQRNELRSEIINELQSLLPNLPLLTATLLFVRCYSAYQVFPMLFKQLADIVGKKLNETSTDVRIQDQEAAFIALQKLNNIDLSQYLLEFIKGTLNLSNLFQFNSSIFFQYFANEIPLDSLNNVLLSTMYLSELTFDVESVKTFIINNQNDKFCIWKEWKQLWNDSSNNREIMTYRMAIWITNYLETSNRTELFQIIEDISYCSMIERAALVVIKEWLQYQKNKHLKIFAQYAALQLIIEGSNISSLIDIISEMFDIDDNHHLKVIIRRLFTSRHIDLLIFRQILIILNRNVLYYSNISAWIDRKDMLEIILNLEFERITLNMHRSSKFLTRSFLPIIDSCSSDLQRYLMTHLRTFINKKVELRNTSKEEYVAVISKWIIESSMFKREPWKNMAPYFSQELYKYIFTLLHNQRFPQIQKAIINGINSMSESRHNDDTRNDAIDHLRQIIYSYDTYSKDVLAVCLLAYGNLLVDLIQKNKNDQKVSDKIQNVFTKLLQTSSSETISVRAAFCLIFSEQTSILHNTITNWFRNKSNFTPEMEYNVLLQQTLCQRKGISFDMDVIEIVKHIKTNSTELLDKFIIELYNYLYNESRSLFLADPAPDYVRIAQQLIKNNVNIFRNAVQKSAFGEDNFKRELYLYHKKKVQNCTAIVELYTSFGILTMELVEMLEYMSCVSDNITWTYPESLMQIPDKEVIEKLYQQLDSTIYYTKFKFFSCVLRLLVYLAQAHIISLSDLHRRVSLVLNDRPDENNLEDSYHDDEIYDFLLNLSCIKPIDALVDGFKLYAESDINKEFVKTIKEIEHKSFLFLRRDYLFTIFQPESSSSIEQDDFTNSQSESSSSISQYGSIFLSNFCKLL